MVQIETESLRPKTSNPYHVDWFLPSNKGCWDLLPDGGGGGETYQAWVADERSHAGTVLGHDVEMTRRWGGGVHAGCSIYLRPQESVQGMAR